MSIKISGLTAVADADLSDAAIVPVTDATGTTTKATMAQVAKRVRANSGIPTLKDYGAVGNGIADDTVAVQAAFTAGGRVDITAGTYLITAPLQMAVPTWVRGVGTASVLKVSAAMGASSDVIHITPAIGNGRLYRLERFYITPASGTPARYGVHLDLTTTSALAAQFSIDSVNCDQLGSHAFHLTNPTNVDGFFTSDLTRNLFYGGIYLQRAGDSIRIAGNILTGLNAGVEFGQVSSAAQIVIEENNITSSGGAIIVHAGDQTKILRNQIEMPSANTGAMQAAVTILGDTAAVASTEIVGNNINVGVNLAYCIDVQNAVQTHIRDNAMNCDTTKKHINIGAAAQETIIHDSNDFRVNNSGGAAAKIDDAGAQTFGPPITVSSFSNSWVAYDATNSPVRYSRNEAGVVTLEGAVRNGTLTVGTTIFTLPVGFRPSKAVYFSVASNNAGTWTQGTVLVDVSGLVQIMAGYAAFLGFAGISFKAAL